MMDKAIRIVEEAIANNPECTGRLTVTPRVFGMEKGPFGGFEILALLRADGANQGCWFGHVFLHPEKKRKYGAALVWVNYLANAPTVPLLFQRFHYWTTIRLEYHPVSVQALNDAYYDEGSFLEATQALVTIINRFDLDKRWPNEDSEHSESPPEMRVFRVYFSERQGANKRVTSSFPAITGGAFRDEKDWYLRFPIQATLGSAEDDL